MENISQASINEMIAFFEANDKPHFAKELKDAEIIPALYIKTYLETVDKLRLETQISHTKKGFDKFKKDDFVTFYKKMGFTSNLELGPYIDTPEKFYGMCILLANALTRKNLICDFDDAKFPRNKTGRCESDTHLDNIDGTPIVAMPDNLEEKFNKIMDSDDYGSVTLEYQKQFIEYFNPSNQKLHLILDIDDDTSKYLNSVHSYVCDTCLDVIGEDGDDGQIACDTEQD